MADEGDTKKRKTVKARNFLARRRGGKGEDSNMARPASTGGGGIEDTATNGNTSGEKVTGQPGSKSKQRGLGRAGSSRSQKRTATSPLYSFFKNVKIAFSPKSKLASTSYLSTPLNKIQFEGDGQKSTERSEGASVSGDLAQSLSLPLPKFDPDNEVLQPPSQPASAAANVKLDGPVTLASIQAVNQSLLQDFCGRVKRELKIRDEYINEMTVKLNAMSQLLFELVTKLAEYEHRFEELENAYGTYDSRSQRRERMLRDVVLLVDGLTLEKDQTHEARIVLFLNEHFDHPHGREFIPADVTCAYSIGKPKDNKRTIKIVFQTAWLRRYVFNQRFKLKGTGRFLNEELPATVGKMAFEAREAKRKGLITKCKATPMGLTVTTLEDELVEVDDLDELFDLLSDLSEAGTADDPKDMDITQESNAGDNGNRPQTGKGVEMNMSNEILLQVLLDKGLLDVEGKPTDVLKKLQASTGKAATVHPPPPTTQAVVAEVHA